MRETRRGAIAGSSSEGTMGHFTMRSTQPHRERQRGGARPHMLRPWSRLLGLLRKLPQTWACLEREALGPGEWRTLPSIACRNWRKGR